MAGSPLAGLEYIHQLRASRSVRSNGPALLVKRIDEQRVATDEREFLHLSGSANASGKLDDSLNAGLHGEGRVDRIDAGEEIRLLNQSADPKALALVNFWLLKRSLCGAVFNRSAERERDDY